MCHLIWFPQPSCQTHRGQDSAALAPCQLPTSSLKTQSSCSSLLRPTWQWPLLQSGSQALLCQSTGAPQECQAPCEPHVNATSQAGTETLLATDCRWRAGSMCRANRLLFGVGAALGLSLTCLEHMDSRVILGGPALQLQQIAIYFTWSSETPSSPQAEIYNILYLKSGLLYPAGMLTAKALMEC